MILLLLVSAAMLGYIYTGYPLLLRLCVWIRGPRPVKQGAAERTVSFVISAHNEAAVIRRKLTNTLEIDYPASRLEIAVISDASTDGTDDIVREFAARGVRLLAQPERKGKTAGLNAAVPLLGGDVIVFSDANALYEPNALKALVRNFADPDVGCVTGEARYLPGGRAAADIGERAYWGYEMRIKRLETAVGSMVGGDGAIYAIRRSLWRDLPENAINDFLNPLQVVAAGWRAVYEPEAICYEETGGGVLTEYRRRVRIVSRSWRAVFQARAVLNPFKVGLFAWSIVSHKVLRWLSGAFVIGAVLPLGIITAQHATDVPVRMALGAVTILAAASIALPRGRRVAAMLGYFAVINAASLAGILKGSSGRVSGVWATPREAAAASAKPCVPVGQLFLAAGAGAAVLTIAAAVAIPHRIAVTAFWTSAVLLAYVYGGYPAILGLARRRAPVRGPSGSATPTVCLVIAANDEEGVIEAKLHNALALTYPSASLDVVVASDGSVDATNTIVRRFADRGVRLIAFPSRRGKIAAINDAMRSVDADIVVFSDANTFLEPDAVQALVARFADDNVGAVSGDVELVGERAAFGRSEDLYYQYERWLQHAESDVGSLVGVDGALYAIRRRLFVAPQPDTVLDDMAIPMAVVRAGYRVVFAPEARAVEQGSQTAREEFARKARVIAGAVQFLSRHDSAVPVDQPQVMLTMLSHKALRWLSPIFATGALAASIALAHTAPIYAAAAAGQAAVVVLGLAGSVPGLRKWKAVAIAHYFCLVQGAAGIGFIRGLAGGQSVLWRRFSRTPVAEVAVASPQSPAGVR